jgi:hypothetical protein
VDAQGEVERLQVNQLGGVVACLVNFRHREYDWLCAQIEPSGRIGRIGIWRDHPRVIRRGDAPGVADLVERCFESEQQPLETFPLKNWHLKF